MPKKKKTNAVKKRQKDKLRKRAQRHAESHPTGESKQLESVETVDGSISDTPGNFPGFSLMGLPPKEEKPLARVQASPCVKMHPPAPRLPSPRGSRLFVQKGKAPSPDSPPWVCAPPRAPGLDMDMMSDLAGQAQLGTSRVEGTSMIIKKDEGYPNDIQKETKKKTNRTLNEKPDIVENMCGNTENMMETKDISQIMTIGNRKQFKREINKKQLDGNVSGE